MHENRLKHLKIKYDKFDVEVLSCESTLEIGGVYEVTEDRDGKIYVSPSHGSEISVYSGTKKKQRSICRYNHQNERNIGLNNICYDVKTHSLIISDFSNYKLYRFDLNIMKISAVFSYPPHDETDQNKKRLRVSGCSHVCYGDVPMGPMVNTDDGILVLACIPELNSGVERFTLHIFKVNDYFEYVEPIFFLKIDKTIFKKNRCICYDDTSDTLFLLYNSRYICRIESGRHHQIFDSYMFESEISSIAFIDGYIYATVVNSYVKLIKLSVDGSVIYQFHHHDILSPTWIGKVSGSLAIVSRGNSKVIFLTKN